MEKLEKEHYYHIFNRGINSEVIFKNDANKNYFLQLMSTHLTSNFKILAYCLMDNHFHLAVEVISNEKDASQALSNLFNAYAKAFNKQQNRTGSLFERRFKRIKIKEEKYLKNLVLYIHKNPQNHEVVNDFKNYEFTSFHKYLSREFDDLCIDTSFIFSLFNDKENFIYSHSTINEQDLSGFENLTGQLPTSMKDKFYQYIQNLQDTITSKLQAIDGKATFKEDIWKRSEGGGGRTRVIENGAVFEKGGVNISGVHGKLPESMQTYFNVGDVDFFACGLSLVLHPKNPMVPTVHANWRYFEMYNEKGDIIDSWFGGGQDLTPYYFFEEDTKHFHSVCKTACDRHNDSFYKVYKKKCDEYFYNSHRGEGRGVGGLFFDYCKKSDLSTEALAKEEVMTMQNWYDFVTEVGDSFLEAYVPIVEKRKNLSYIDAHRNWQEIRRGRYVEFNLVHDKGTLFGLKTNGRIESILMSLPPHVQWVYDHHPEKGSEEEKLIQVLQNPRNWV